MNIQHGKLITTESYYDGTIASTKHEMEVSIFSTKEGILRDVIDAMGLVASGETHKLTLEVCVDSKQRYRLVKRWSEL